MSNIITARDLAMVTSDIQYAQRQGARQLASNLIEIGRLLVEAKSMVEPKDWEKYIWDNFGYSTSSADNWMKLYKEYGDDQESLFDSFRDSQTFGRMSYTKLLALTAIPAEERAEFVERNDVENISTRQLQQLIKERDEARAALENAEAAARKRDDEAEQAESAAKAQADAARESEKKALDQVEKLKKQLSNAKDREKKALEDLEKAQQNPNIPESVMEEMRSKAEEEAARKAAQQLQKDLAAANQAAEEATRAKEVAERAAKEAEDKLVAAQKAAKMSNPDVVTFQALYLQLQDIWNRAAGAYQKVKMGDEASGVNCRKALEAAMNKVRSDLEAAD